MYAVIMAGGQGTRFWPVSRKSHPKQFLDLDGSGSLLAKTVKRLEPIFPPANIFVVTARSYKEEVLSQLPEGYPPEQVISEPVGRNTAPCIGLAAVVLQREDPDAVMAVLPADHHIRDEDSFRSSLKVGLERARANPGLVTFGMLPTYPETGYGYIRMGEVLEKRDGVEIKAVRQFREKPDLPTAETYLASGEYLWNAGIFCWKISSIVDAIQQHLPSLFTALQDIKSTLQQEEELERLYQNLEPVSIDYGVMEKAKNVEVVPAECGWSDLGSWVSLGDLLSADKTGNVVNGRHFGMNTRNSVVYGKKRLIVTLGCEDLIVVETDDVVFVGKKDHAQELSKLVQELRKKGLEEYL